jgi:hypothetical protein
MRELLDADHLRQENTASAAATPAFRVDSPVQTQALARRLGTKYPKPLASSSVLPLEFLFVLSSQRTTTRIAPGRDPGFVTHEALKKLGFEKLPFVTGGFKFA